MAIDDHRKRRHPDDDDSDADRKRPYQPSSSTGKSLSASTAAAAAADLPYDSTRKASRVGFRLGQADKEPPRRSAERRAGDDDDDEEEEEDKTVLEARLRLDAYRKDAIYRHFLQSKRELIRAQERLEEKEERLLVAEERIQAFDIFWETLAEDLLLLFKDEAALEDADRTAFLDAIPFTSTPITRKAFSDSMEARTAATRSVLSRIVALAPKSEAPEVDTLRARCHERTTEIAFLKTHLASAQATIDTLSDELSDTKEALSRVELRSDRSQSVAVRSAEMSGQERAAEEAARAEREALLADVEKLKAEREQQRTLPNGAVGAAGGGAGGDLKPVNGSSAENGAEEGSPAQVEAKARADLAERLNEAQKISAKRLDELSKLRSQLAEAEGQLSRLRRDLDYIPDGAVRRSELFKSADREVVRKEREIEYSDSKYLRIRKENEELREKMLKHKEEITKTLKEELDTVRATLAKRDADLNRVRTNRDELQGELNERKAKDKDKFCSAEETRTLLTAKEILLGVLGNENRAWRMKDAARRGDQVAMDALLQQGASSGTGTEPPISVEDQLFARVKAAEALARDRQLELEARNMGASEVELVANLAKCRKELDELKVLLTGVAEQGPEAVKERLSQQSEKIAELERKVITETTRADAACDDLDKMSQAFEETAKLAEDKVKHLTTLEDRVIRLNTEKSKADNKFFAAMRSKEALEAERKASLRNAERQNLVIQQLTETEKTHAAHAAALELELTTAGKLRDELEKRVQRLETQVANASSESSAHREKSERSGMELSALQKERGEVDVKLFKLTEERAALTKEIQKAKADRDAALAAKEKALKRRGTESSGGSSNNEEAESLRALLRCSSCKDNFRERIITKCMHTFCAQCIEARIQTRQRKCPHCGIAFAQSDVQMLYLQ